MRVECHGPWGVPSLEEACGRPGAPPTPPAPKPPSAESLHLSPPQVFIPRRQAALVQKAETLGGQPDPRSQASPRDPLLM